MTDRYDHSKGFGEVVKTWNPEAEPEKPRLAVKPERLSALLPEKKKSPEVKELKPLELEMASAAEASIKHPERCEDKVGAWEKYGLFALADGAGGHAKGDVIAQEAINAIDDV